MKIRVNQYSNINVIINSLNATELQKQDIELYLKELIGRDKELSEMKIKRYSMSKNFYIDGIKITFFIRSDNYLDKLKRIFIKNGI